MRYRDNVTIWNEKWGPKSKCLGKGQKRAIKQTKKHVIIKKKGNK